MDRFDINRFLKVFSEILSDEYGVRITMTATPKDPHRQGVAIQ